MEPPPDCSSCYMKGDEYSRKSMKREQGGEKDDFLDLASKTGNSSNAERLQSSTSGLLKNSKKPSSVRSSAIIEYSASKNHAMFYLKPETNLNLAPSNWLRKTVGSRPETVLPGSRYTANPDRSFSGFNIASSHLNHVGKVDVVSDAENIKKLLKMPYSKAHVSMAIHRIGRTLLLENFDIKKFTAEESEWQWFRNFYQELVQQQGNNILLKKKKSPSSQYDRLMLSKFLYYSMYKDFNKLEKESGNNDFQERVEGEGFEDVKDDVDSISNSKLVEIDEKETMIENDVINELSSVLQQPIIGQDSSSIDDTSGAVVLSDRRWRYWTPHDFFQPESSEAFERNISWTFEDLQMMLGTNMPIFGGGRYPAVSLRLRDSTKPINILTGIDYWLDNLICNVPELVMCFHVNGIVQNYEVIKTEDIPRLEHSSFSPHVVKDIAQNILSFLKSNCTKEGHTYWLFKGSGDDVVKLYDLTTLCHTTSDEQTSNKNNLQKNPYIFSVAMLLYKTALSLMQSRDTCDHRATVKKLLGQCIDLLDHTKYKYIVSSATCILSTLCLPDPGLDRPAKETPGKEKMESPKENDHNSYGTEDWKACDTCTAHHNADLTNQRKNSEGPKNTEVATIPSVTDLSIPERYQPVSASFDLIRSPPNRVKKHVGEESVGEVEENCFTAISYVVSALDLLIHDVIKEDWQKSLLCQVTRNAALAYFRLAEQASNLGKLGRALRRSRLALQSYETFQYLSTDRMNLVDHDSSRPPDFQLLLPRLLSLCGEIQFSVVEDIRAHGAVSSSNREEFTSFTEDDTKIRSYLSDLLPEDGKYFHFTKLSSEIDQSLQSCARCYEMGLRIMDELCPPKKDSETTPNYTTKGNKEGKSKGKSKSKRASTESPSVSADRTPEQKQADLICALRMVLIRRHGHVVNELGANALNRAVTLLGEESKKENRNQKLWGALDEANKYFEKAQLIFLRVNDITNQALVLSNMGRLMRVSTQFYSNNEDGQLSKQERECYAKAIEKYQKALILLGPKDPKRGCPPRLETGVATCTTVYDNISWELSSSYFSMAQILQDNAPQEQHASEEAEKEVISLMNNSLKYCKDIWENTPKQTVALYRQSKIYYRMASLHHNTYRSCSDGHKCKQLRSLAEKHYLKSLMLLEGLEHPNEIIHVQLERLSMKEHHITSLSNSNQKVKLLLEGLEMICDCIGPLKQVENSTKIATKSSSSQVDGREQSTSFETEIKEVSKLLRILAKILQSILFHFVKLSQTSALFEREYSFMFKQRKFQGKSAQQNFKDIYSKSLRELQVLYDETNKESYPEFQRNVSTVLRILNDISNFKTK